MEILRVGDALDDHVHGLIDFIQRMTFPDHLSDTIVPTVRAVTGHNEITYPAESLESLWITA